MNPEIEAVLRGDLQWCVVNADGDAVARELGDASVDHVICDPGYDAKTHVGARRGGSGELSAGINFDTQSDMSFLEDLFRCSRRWVITFCALEQFGAYAAAAGEKRWIRGGVWVKSDGMPQMSGDRPGQPGEGVAIMHREGRKRWNGGGKLAKWIGNKERDDRVHPTQKPLWLLMEIVSDFTDPGDVILDVRAGSCTTGVACLQLGRRFIGVELDPVHYANGSERMTAAQVGLSVKESRAGQSSLFSLPGMSLHGDAPSGKPRRVA